MLATTLLIATLVRAFAIAAFVIPSQSMMPGLITGDFFLASKWSYGWSSYAFASRFRPFEGRVFSETPKRGDVVIFAGINDPGVTYIKRVMGLPGDVVEMREGKLILNGKELPQRLAGVFVLPLGPTVSCLTIPGIIDQRVRMRDGRIGCRWYRLEEQMPDGSSHEILDFAVARTDTFGPARVPPGHFFMLGDNRDDSLDSRIPVDHGGLGMVPADRILGKARWIVATSNGHSVLLRPWSWAGSISFARAGTVR